MTMASAIPVPLSLIASGMFLLGGPPSHTATTPIHVSARAAILVDARTGAILYEKRAFVQKDPASITKMMTALLVIEQGKLHRVVAVSPQAASTIGSSLHIRVRQRYTVMDLLRGLLLRSGNDAAVALAEADAGSVPRFVAEMNIKAQELGAFNTSFENPNGLTAPGHYSSAYDLSLIARAALDLPTFRKLVGTREDVITEQRSGHARHINNTNQLLYSFPGADGIKTGTTNAAGKCLAASATVDGRQLIAVVLHSGDRFSDAARLLRWGFQNSKTVIALKPGSPITMIPVLHGDSDRVAVGVRQPIWVTYSKDSLYQIHLAAPVGLTAPVAANRIVGRVVVTASDQPPETTSLVTIRAVPRKRVHETWWQWVRKYIKR